MTDGHVPAGAGRHVLRLLITGATPRSTRAIENIRRLLERELPGRYDLEVIDIYQHPQAASQYQVLAAPTLVKLLPEPVRRIIGDLSDIERVLHGLGIEPTSPRDDDEPDVG